MKKVLIVFGIFIFLLTGCETKEKTGDDPIICDDGYSLIDNECVLDDVTPEVYVASYDFSTDTVSTRDEVIEKVVFYQGKIQNLIGSSAEGELSSGLTRLSTGETFYTREDFALYDNQEYNETSFVDIESLMNTEMTISTLKDTISRCESFVEGEFCDVAALDYEYAPDSRILMQTDGDRLYIESYRYNANLNYVSAEIMFFDLIDGLVYFEYVRDNNENIGEVLFENVYYDRFIEGFGATAVAIRAGGEIYYQFDSTDGLDRLNFRILEGEKYISYRSRENQIYYTYSYSQYRDTDKYYIDFQRGTKSFLKYKFNSFNTDVIVQWNLLETTGWDKIGLTESNECHIYNGDVEILTDFYRNAFHSYVEYAEIARDYDESELTQSIIDLSDYGLLFSEVTLEQINTERDNLIDNFDILKTYHGFSESDDLNRQELLDMYPFFANEDIIAELSALVVLDDE